MNVAFCILSGGQSRRFNQDKAKAILGKKRLIDYPLELILQYTDTIYISCQYDKTKDRISNENKDFKAIKIRDEKPFLGPLCGIYYVTKKTDYDYYMFLGLDMPFITKEMLDELLNEIKDSVYTAAFACNDTKMPLPILISKRAANDFFQKKDCKNRGIKELLINRKTKIIEWRNCDNLININTQEDLQKAEILLTTNYLSGIS